MTRNEFRKLTERKVVVLDGSTGVALQKRGMPAGVCPEKWAADNKQALLELQKQYIEAGSDIIFTFTFGASPFKLREFGLEKDAFELNKTLAGLARQAAGSRALVAGDIAPSGHFPRPFGEVPFEEHVNMFKEQVRGLLAGGVDLFVIETMMDIQEARAAVIAVKESCGLPVMASMTFDKDKRTLTGTTPLSALVTLQSLGVDAFGANCSTGPAEMLEVIREIKPYSKIPLFAKPNAGLPRLEKGKTVFDMQSSEFCTFAKPLIDAGAGIIGGCCGTSPEYIKGLSSQVRGIKPKKPPVRSLSALSSVRSAVLPGKGHETVIIGERINPTGKKQLQAELKEGRDNEIRRFAFEQEEAGAKVLDVNTGMPGIDQVSVMLKAVHLLSNISSLPLCIDSSDPEVIEAALREYPGRALINSISAEAKLGRLLQVAAKYGAMFIALPIDEKGIPVKPAARLSVLKKIVNAAAKLGFTKDDIVADALVMTVSSDQKAALATLETVNKAAKLVSNTVVGLSNVSFGLPARPVINSTFFNMAKDSGLTMAIANPAADLKIRDAAAEKLLRGKDPNAAEFIAKYGGSEQSKIPDQRSKIEVPASSELIYECVVKGDRDSILRHIDAALSDGEKPSDIVDKKLIPAINHVGELFDKRIYFLPQLIQSAETVKTAFSKLEPLLSQSTAGNRKTPVILATVKGDIHDIGKNIVALMLRNYGFDVHDLGKDVDAITIVKKAKETGSKIIGLSALMTTTMVEMKTVVELARKEKLDVKIMIGGAVVTADYAAEIGADAYAKDAYEAVKLAKKLTESK